MGLIADLLGYFSIGIGIVAIARGARDALAMPTRGKWIDNVEVALRCGAGVFMIRTGIECILDKTLH